MKEYLTKMPITPLVIMILVYIIDSMLSYALVIQKLSIAMPKTNYVLNILQSIIFFVFVVLWTSIPKYQNSWPALRIVLMLFVALLTLKLILSIAALVSALLDKGGDNGDIHLLWDAYIVWVANVLTFAVWYRLIDREEKPHFWFPIQANDNIPDSIRKAWKPNLIDYWFLSFNTSTAFSPTDTFVLSRFGKVLMILQSSISLVVLVILVSRAVNILKF